MAFDFEKQVIEEHWVLKNENETLKKYFENIYAFFDENYATLKKTPNVHKYFSEIKF